MRARHPPSAVEDTFHLLGHAIPDLLEAVRAEGSFDAAEVAISGTDDSLWREAARGFLVSALAGC